jgi:endonuclease-3
MPKPLKKTDSGNETILKRIVKTLALKLIDYYPDFKPRTRHDPLDELILTILSQNTNDNNSDQAFIRLKTRYPKWDQVARAKSGNIEDLISVAGLGNTKTRYILSVLKEIGDENLAHNRLKKGSPYHLDHVKKMNLENALEYLTGFKGVGQKTAACVLAFSCMMPAFPVDTHIHRILIRQGIIPEKMGAGDAHEVMYRITEPDDRYRFHINLIRYGREICHARNPECGRCVIRKTCVYIEKVVTQ